MNKKNLIIVLIIILLGSIILYIKENPPLSVGGVSCYDNDKTKRVIGIENCGFVDLKLNRVLVNKDEAKKVELCVSRSNHLVAGSGLDRDPNITFHPMHKFHIKPESIVEDVKSGSNSIKHYGLRIWSYEEPKKITIRYTYLGIPFSLKVNVGD